MSVATTNRTQKWKKTLLSGLFGAVVGGAVVTALMRLGGADLARVMDGSRLALTATGVMYLLIAVMIGLGLAAPRTGAKVLNVDDAEELVDERPKLIRSILYMAVLGAALMLLGVARSPDFAAGLVAPGVALAAMALLFLLSLVSFLWMKYYDELDRQMGLEGGAWAFFLSAGVLLPWAALDALGWNARLNALDVITVLSVSLLAGSFIAVGRRGMMVR